ncbi:hypothetical protein GE09DRAFT_1214170 [Coniochaeta sp. 2T2.1]|nr:hypothetical protein GE09DRAFT_1214170 [Coniochaeta sp. 2T2.1]
MSATKQQPTPINTSTSSSQSPQQQTADLAEELTSPVSPTTPHTAVDAQRGMSHVGEWKPEFNRRQSWSKEEHKHALQMGGVMRDNGIRKKEGVLCREERKSLGVDDKGRGGV